LSVSNWEKSKDFYDSLMREIGFKEGIVSEKGYFALKEYASGDHILMIQYEKGKEYEGFNRFPGLNHIAFWVRTKELVDNLYIVVKNLNVEITRPPREYPEYGKGYYAFYFRDPDGIPLEIAYY